MNTDCTSTGYREPTPFYVCFIPLPPPYSSSIKRASTHATVAPPPISDHPLAFRALLNHPRGPYGESAACCVMITSHVGWIRSWSEAWRRELKLWRSRTKILKFCLLYNYWNVNGELWTSTLEIRFVNLDIGEIYLINRNIFKIIIVTTLLRLFIFVIWEIRGFKRIWKIRFQCKDNNFRTCGALNYFNNFFSFFQRDSCLQNETEELNINSSVQNSSFIPIFHLTLDNIFQRVRKF